MTAQHPAHDISRWRSLLFVPANVPRFIDKAAGLDVDIVILDLEDSIAPDAKGAAREAAVVAASRL
jgi:citrate lyase subunit beta/citryl-CoA lyase